MGRRRGKELGNRGGGVGRGGVKQYLTTAIPHVGEPVSKVRVS